MHIDKNKKLDDITEQVMYKQKNNWITIMNKQDHRFPTIDNTCFGGSFMQYNPSSIFIPEDFNSDEILMINTAKEFSKKEVLPNSIELEKQSDGLMPNILKKAGQLGFCGLDTPEEYSGLGLSKTLSARILEHLSLDASFSVTIGISGGISQIGPILFGTQHQKEKYLHKLASGEWIGAYALSEPESGSDALSISTTAKKINNKYILNGTKMWISNAKWADFFVVFAKLEDIGFTAFLIEKDTPGLSISREEHKMGLKGSSTARLLLDMVSIPEENLLYIPGKGHHVAFNALNMGRFKLGAMSLGPARESIFQAVEYALDRKQFGKSISEFKLIRKKFSDIAARFFAAESTLYRTGSLIDASFHYYHQKDEDSIQANRKSAEEFAIECSASKIFCTEAEGFIIDECLQVYGGYGFTEEFPLARHYRDCRVSRIYEGTNEINRMFLSSRIFKSIKEGKLQKNTTDDSFISSLLNEALKKADQNNDYHIASVSNLAMLHYADQSTRIRAARTGEIGHMLYETFASWAEIQALNDFQFISEKKVLLPSRKNHSDHLSDHIYQTRGPL